jgi:hypothetical protein
MSSPTSIPHEAFPGASLEQSIDATALWLSTAPTVEQRRSAWNLLRTLVRLRTESRVKQMEDERGISCA